MASKSSHLILKKVSYTFVILFLLILGAEVVCRIKYFYLHKGDWNYITAPFKVSDTQRMDHSRFMPPENDRMTVKWQKPCRDKKVFSQHFKKNMDYTFDQYCFRGDRLEIEKNQKEFRVFVLGGSTVQDKQSDREMMTSIIKAQLPSKLNLKTIKVVNAGHSAFDSEKIVNLYKGKIKLFSPDLVLYYQAWNEQNAYLRWFDVDADIDRRHRSKKIHRVLHYNSLLYTYLIEKYSFSNVKSRRLWKIDIARLEKNILLLADEVQRAGGQFVFLSEAANAPRYFRGIDTFSEEAILQRIEHLKNDSQYVYDKFELQILNQRLAVIHSMKMCKKNNIPFINILNEVEKLGDKKRSMMFKSVAYKTIEGNKEIGTLIGRKLTKLFTLQN